MFKNIKQVEPSCHNFPLVRDKPPRGARICEAGLLSVDGTVAIWLSVIIIRFCCFSDMLVAGGLAPARCQGIRGGYKQLCIGRLLLIC